MATQQYINYGAEPNDGTGDPLRDAFIKVDENFSNLWASGPVASNITITNNTIAVSDTNGNLVLSPNGIGIIQTKNNIIPSIGNVYSLGSSSLYYRSAYLGPGGVYSTGNITTTGYFIGDGSRLGNITVAGGSEIVNGNSNVVVAANSSVSIGVAGVSNVAVFNTSNIEVNGLITATGNVSGVYILGNGSQLTGLPDNYGNADVSNFLASGNNTSNITTTANIAGTYFLGNGSQLTGLPVQYSNANVTTLLANFGSNVISTTGNITAGYFVGNGLLLTNITAGNIVGTVANATYALNANAATYSINAIQANVANVANSVAGANVSGTVSSATTAGTVTTNAQPNITSVGNLESLIVTGNITSSANISGAYILGNGSQLTGLPDNYGNANVADYLPTYSGNLNPGNLTATGNVTGGNVITDNIVGTTITITSNGAINLLSVGNVTVNNKNITELADPVQDQDAATKSYVDSVAQGLDPKASVSLATATTLPAYTYNNGTAGVGATITGSASGLLTIDGTAPTVGDRVLIKNESGGNAPYNGIYVVTTNDAGSPYVLTRSIDMNQAAEVPGAFVFVELGAVNADSGYVCTTNAPVVIGTTNIVWTQFSSAGSYTANTSAGLVLNGSVFSAKVDETTTAFDGTGNIIVKASATLITPNIGNATGNSLILSGNGLISATTATLSGNVLAGNVNSNADVTGTTITASGNLVGGNVNITSTVNTATVVASGNINAGNLITGGILSVTGNANVGNIGATTVTATNLTGTLTTAAQPNITSVGTLISLDVTGNVSTGNVSGATGTFTNVAGTLTTAAQTNITSVGTLGALTVTGNVSGGNLSTLGNVSANYYLGNGSQLTGVIANSANAETLTGTFLANNVIGSSLTSVGSLSGLTVSNTTGVVDFSNTANVTLGNVSNLHITGGVNGYVLSTDGAGNLSWVPDGIGNVVGNAVAMGTNTLGNLVSNAVTLTTSTTVTDGITQLNAVLGKLVPPSPPNFPASQSIAVASLSTFRMTNYTQTDNTPGANKSVAGGTTVSTVRRASSYSTNTITTAGPGDSGTLTVYLNGVDAGNVTFNTGASPSANGVYSNLVVTNNFDYRNANANIAAGFWYVFSSQASGTVSQGWNEVYIADTAAGNTNTYSWFYDSSAPGTPAFSSLGMAAPGSPSYVYSSTVPHYNNTNAFAVTFDVNRLSGNMYPTSDTFVTGSAGGAFGAPASVTYAGASITTPLAQNLYVSSGNASVSTTSTVISGFGASTTGPSVSVVNSYNTGTQAFTATLNANVLYKTGTVSSASRIEEANVFVGTTIGVGSGLAFRIANPGSTNTPVYTGNAAAFNSQTGPLQTYDSTVVANVLKHDQTNYATGYLPAGPNLSAGRSGTQYFTFKIIRTSVSKFDVKWSGNIAGLWVALPGSTIDSTSGANGWIDMSTAYGGAGIPGVNPPGNGSDGCALGGVAPLNSVQTNKAVTATFGTVSSSDTATNEIYIRLALTSGQSVTALSLQTASN